MQICRFLIERCTVSTAITCKALLSGLTFGICARLNMSRDRRIESRLIRTDSARISSAENSRLFWDHDSRALEAKRELYFSPHWSFEPHRGFIALLLQILPSIRDYRFFEIPRRCGGEKERKLSWKDETRTAKETRWSRKTSDTFSLNTPDRTNAGQLKPVSIYASRHTADGDFARALSN